MEKENNVVYVKTKNGIYKCYKSEQMNKPIYYPVESKTNSFIDYDEVTSILSIDDLYNELKNQKEIIDKANRKMDCIFANGDNENILDDLLILNKILEDKEK